MSWPTDGKPRYVVREHTGFRINPMAFEVGGGKRRVPGISIRVVDRGYAWRTVDESALEDDRRRTPREEKIAAMRDRAEQICEELNARE